MRAVTRRLLLSMSHWVLFSGGRRRRRAYPTSLATNGDARTRSQVSAEQSTAQEVFNVEDTSPQLPKSASSALSSLTPTEASLVGP